MRKSLRKSQLPKGRVSFITVGVILAFLALLMRLAYVQVIHAPVYAAYGRNESAQRVYVPAIRGPIYARDGRLLAESVQREDIVADPFLIHHPANDATKLASLL